MRHNTITNRFNFLKWSVLASVGIFDLKISHATPQGNFPLISHFSDQNIPIWSIEADYFTDLNTWFSTDAISSSQKPVSLSTCAGKLLLTSFSKTGISAFLQGRISSRSLSGILPTASTFKDMQSSENKEMSARQILNSNQQMCTTRFYTYTEAQALLQFIRTNTNSCFSSHIAIQSLLSERENCIQMAYGLTFEFFNLLEISINTYQPTHSISAPDLINENKYNNEKSAENSDKKNQLTSIEKFNIRCNTYTDEAFRPAQFSGHAEKTEYHLASAGDISLNLFLCRYGKIGATFTSLKDDIGGNGPTDLVLPFFFKSAEHTQKNFWTLKLELYPLNAIRFQFACLGDEFLNSFKAKSLNINKLSLKVSFHLFSTDLKKQFSVRKINKFSNRRSRMSEMVDLNMHTHWVSKVSNPIS